MHERERERDNTYQKIQYVALDLMELSYRIFNRFWIIGLL